METLSDHVPSPRISPRGPDDCQSDSSVCRGNDDHCAPTQCLGGSSCSLLSNESTHSRRSWQDVALPQLPLADTPTSSGSDTVTPSSFTFSNSVHTPLEGEHDAFDLKAFKRRDLHTLSTTDASSSTGLPSARSTVIRLSSKISDTCPRSARGTSHRSTLHTPGERASDHGDHGPDDGGDDEEDFVDDEDDDEDDGDGCLFIDLPWVMQVSSEAAELAIPAKRSFKRKRFRVVIISTLSLLLVTLSVLLFVVLSPP